jgi:hypothetical protein
MQSRRLGPGNIQYSCRQFRAEPEHVADCNVTGNQDRILTPEHEGERETGMEQLGRETDLSCVELGCPAPGGEIHRRSRGESGGRRGVCLATEPQCAAAMYLG